MKKVTQQEFDEAKVLHSLWLIDGSGKQMDFSFRDLRCADLESANLRCANLRGANLRDTVLHDADLRCADLRDAHLRDADLESANLRGADLRGAKLQGSNLHGANLDFSCWPLWCGSNHVKVDAKITAQLAAHFCVLDCDDPAYLKARDAVLEFAKTSHRAQDLGLLED